METSRRAVMPTRVITFVQPEHYYHLALANGVTLEVSGAQLIRIAEQWATGVDIRLSKKGD